MTAGSSGKRPRPPERLLDEADDASSSFPADSVSGSMDRFLQRAAHQGDRDDVDYGAVLEQFVEADDRGLLVIGPGRRVVAINPAGRALLGFTGELPQPVGEVVRDLNAGFAVGEALHDRRDVRCEVYVPDPHRLLRFHFVPILRSSGEPALVVGSIEDITRLRYLETVRRDFVANVSHELRTPIASINLLVETLQNGAMGDPDAALHFLHRIEVETQAMARLVEELLALSRLEAGSLSLEVQPADVHELLDNVMNRLQPSADEKDIHIQVDAQPELPLVLIDVSRMEQVLMNLVHNAIKFTPQGGSITLRAMRQGLGVQVEIVDTGVGIDPAEAGRVFERF